MWINTAYNEILNLDKVALLTIIKNTTTTKEVSYLVVARETTSLDSVNKVIKDYKTRNQAENYLKLLSTDLNSI